MKEVEDAERVEEFNEGPITLLNSRSANILVTDASSSSMLMEIDTKCPNSDCSDTI